jgi:hypothetical protein
MLVRKLLNVTPKDGEIVYYSLELLLALQVHWPISTLPRALMFDPDNLALGSAVDSRHARRHQDPMTTRSRTNAPSSDQFPSLIVAIGLPRHSDKNSDEGRQRQVEPTAFRQMASCSQSVEFSRAGSGQSGVLARHCLKLRWKVLGAQYSE